MKTPISKILTIILILILIGIGIKLFDFIGINSKDKVKIEIADTQIRALEVENDVLIQIHVRDSVSIDSLTGLIQQGKFEVKYEQKRRKDLEKENKENLARFEILSGDDQVKEFISSTGEDYDVMKYDGYYLVSLKSIQFSKRSFINSQLQFNQIKSLELELKSFNELILDYDKRFELLTTSYISDMNLMLANKDRIINNLNIKIGIYDKSFARLRLTKGLTIGIGIAVIGVLLIK